MSVHQDQRALRAFPELRWLIELRETGWKFQMTTVDGGVEALSGTRTWPDGSVDEVLVGYINEVKATRTNPDGHVVWERQGDLAEVVIQTLALRQPRTPVQGVGE